MVIPYLPIKAFPNFLVTDGFISRRENERHFGCEYYIYKLVKFFQLKF